MSVETLDDALTIVAQTHASLSGPLGTGTRVSANVRRPFTPSPEINENPPVDMGGEWQYPNHLRYSDFDDRPARRGWLAWFLNPAQFWQMDHFVTGKLEYAGPIAGTMVGGMAPDTAQRANILTKQASSYGDLVTLSTDSLGIEPYSGW